MNINLNLAIWIILFSSIAPIIIILIKKSISTYIENAIKAKYDSKIENLRGDISISHSILSNSLLIQSEGIKSTYEKRLKSIDAMWKNILEVERFSKLLFFDSYYTIEEIEKIKKDCQNFSLQAEIAIENSFRNLHMLQFSNIINNITNDLEELRPYLGEELWILRFYYNFFVGRVLHNYKSKYDNNEFLIHWIKDKNIHKILSVIFTKQECEFVYNNKFGTIQASIDIFKQKVLSEISKTTSGILVGKNSVENAIILHRLMKDINTE